MKGMDERTIDIVKTYSRKTGHTSPDASQKNWEFLIETFADGIKNKKILDVGCGSGQLITELSEKSYYSVGLDTSESFRKHLQDSKKCGFIMGDCHQLPFESEVFDLIVSIGTLEHVVNYETAIMEMKRVLRRGGFAFLMLGPTPIWKYFDSKAHRRITVRNPQVSTVLNLLKDGRYEKVWAHNVRYRLTMMPDFKIRANNRWMGKMLNSYLIKRMVIILCFILEKINLEQNIAVVYRK